MRGGGGYNAKMRLDPRRTAGLPLSVGSASPATRVFLATLFASFAAVLLAAAIFIARTGPWIAAAVAVLLIFPLGVLGILGAIYTLAPFSRFGVWLDIFLGNLTGRRFALVLAGVWLVGAIVVMIL